jgi:hypothetical protein
MTKNGPAKKEVESQKRAQLGAASDTSRMGFNPHRKQKKRASDIYLVIGALVITMALVVWAFRG